MTVQEIDLKKLQVGHAHILHFKEVGLRICVARDSKDRLEFYLVTSMKEKGESEENES